MNTENTESDCSCNRQRVYWALDPSIFKARQNQNTLGILWHISAPAWKRNLDNDTGMRGMASHVWLLLFWCRAGFLKATCFTQPGWGACAVPSCVTHLPAFLPKSCLILLHRPTHAWPCSTHCHCGRHGAFRTLICWPLQNNLPETGMLHCQKALTNAKNRLFEQFLKLLSLG